MKNFRLISIIGCLLLATNVFAQSHPRLTGDPIGSLPVNYGSGYQYAAYAFDNNPSTFYASQDRSNTWVGLDLGTPHVITSVGYMPRAGFGNRVTLGVFEGSNSPDFMDAVPLYVIPDGAKDGKMTIVNCPVTRGFRYVRYVGPHEQRSNIAEVGFYGYEGVGDESGYYQISQIPTLSIHIFEGHDPLDKTTDLACNMTLTYDGGTRIQEYPMTIRGRGNASWGFDKKPYRIKFNDGKKHHMLKDSPRQSPAKAKKWTLISNEGDKTLMRNLLAHEVSRQLQLPYTVYSEPVDVILNGEYKGLYQLCDQVDENKDRIPITEMEVTDTAGDSLTGGYHIEMDAYASGESANITFNSSRGIPFTIKSPDEDVIQPVQRKYIMDYWNSVEQLLWSSYYDDPAKGYMKKLDIDSFLKFFLLGEMTGNTDTYYSTHMYKERLSDMIYISPGWDFDLAFENDSRTYPICNNSNWICLSKGSHAGNSSSMVSRIINGTNANNMLKAIWAEARNSGRLTEEKLVHYLDSLEQLLTPSANLNFKRWPILNQIKHMEFQALGRYDLEVNVARQYIKERFDWMDEKLKYKQGKVYNDTVMYISTPAQLVEFAEQVNKGGNGSVAHLLKDLNMAGVIMPCIGTERYPFHGEFDGRGHKIKNLSIRSGNCTGLIGATDKTCYIHDFIVDENSVIEGNTFVGIVGATIEGTEKIVIERVGNEATIKGDRNVAGIYGCNLGSNARVEIRDCYNMGQINGQSESGTISGWIGNNFSVERTWNCGDVTGYDWGRTLYRYGGADRATRVFSTTGSQGNIVSYETLASGELTWLLNGESSESPSWYQKIGTDLHPMFNVTRGIVYKEEDGTYSNGKFKLGDANADGEINTADIQIIVDYILGREAKGIYLVNADANTDGKVNVLDLVQVGNLIKSGQLLENIMATKEAVLTAANATIKYGYSKRLSTMLIASEVQAVMQVDVMIPEGITANMATMERGNMLTTDHILDFAPIEGGYRMLIYSNRLTPFAAATAVAFVMKFMADQNFLQGTFALRNQYLATANNHISRPSDQEYTFKMDPTTGIDSIDEEMDDDEVYNLQGMRVDNIQRGHIYVIGGKKVLVK